MSDTMNTSGGTTSDETTTELRTPGKFGEGFVDQLLCKSHLDGVSEFDTNLLLENGAVAVGCGTAAYFIKKLVLKKTGKKDFSLVAKIRAKKGA